MVGPWPDVGMTRCRREKNIGFEGALRLSSSTTAKRKKTEARMVMARQ
jgi:hypothetical protein